MDKRNNKLHTVVKAASIAAKVMLVLGGLAICGVFVWLGYKIYLFFGV